MALTNIQIGAWDIHGGALTNIGMGEMQYLVNAKASSDAYYDLLSQRGVSDSVIHTGIADAYSALTNNRNDMIVMYPKADVAAATTWANSNSHLVGASPHCIGYNPCYFTHTADQDVWWTVSGSNNTFTNVRFQHGGSSTTNAHCIELTGSQNRFNYCHFDGPETTAEAALDGYDLVKISNEFNQFTNCYFGNTWNAMTQKSALIGFTGDKNCTTLFKDCYFTKNFGITTALFIHTYQSLNGGCHIIFDNCVFNNTGTTTGTYAIDGYGLNTNNAMMSFNNCSFAGVTDVVAVTYEEYVWFSNNAVYAGNAQMNGLAANPDVS
jgi:hypothetical protein